MGKPNWLRLAELGQLPEYMKDQLPASYSEANENARRSKSLEPNKEPAEEMKDIEQIVDETQKIEEVTKTDVRKDLEKKSKGELQRICVDNGLETTGNKEELIERILAPVEKVEEEQKSEFVDELLK